MTELGGIEPWLEMVIMVGVAGVLGYLLHNTLMAVKLARLRVLEVEHSNLHVERAAAAIERDTLRARGDGLQAERDELSGELEETSARLERTQLALAAFGGDVAVLRRWQEGTDLQMTTLREEIAALRAEAAAAQIGVSVREATTGRAVVEGLASVVSAPHPPANDAARPEPPPPRPVDTFIGRLPDDLTVIMGVDFEVAALLRASGIRTWSDLARRTPERLRILLATTGVERDPSSWPEQARLATAGRWRQLRALQARLARTSG